VPRMFRGQKLTKLDRRLDEPLRQHKSSQVKS
jgi:hypothetical protein